MENGKWSSLWPQKSINNAELWVVTGHYAMQFPLTRRRCATSWPLEVFEIFKGPTLSMAVAKLIGCIGFTILCMKIDGLVPRIGMGLIPGGSILGGLCAAKEGDSDFELETPPSCTPAAKTPPPNLPKETQQRRRL
ncbi:unnamed protein product [Cuscuta campestris]|uniref:Uncharacterized protein n=1 Tax=Cuscuta campestris TaxID=132261 RepID=A0A484KSD7_9ASTE|nr:unnamed protein product [Cuscuta campestris]